MNITKQKKKTRKSNKLDDSCIHSKVRLTNQNAFTLIEMIVVMAVIGVLVLLAAPKFIGYTEQAKLTRDMHLAKTIENSTEAFLLEGGKIEDHLETIQDYHLKNSAKKRMLINNTGYVTEEIITPDVYYEVTHEFLSEILKIKVENETFDKFMLTAEANAKYPIAAYVTKEGRAYVDRTKSLRSEETEDEPIITNCTITPEPDYLFEAATGTIVKYLGTSIHIVIPSSFLVDGKCYPVRIIGKEAFMGKGIVTVKIPDSVKVVEDSAFENNELESVVIPEGVVEIKDEAFKDNNLGPNLKPNDEGYTSDTVPTGPNGGVYLPNDSLENIDKGAFENNDIEKVEIPDSVINVGDNALKGNNISSIDIPGGTIVGSDIMAGNKSPNITIPDGVTVIPKNTFKGSGIVSVVFPEGLERIEAYAFAYNQIIAVNLPSSLKFIGEFAFAYNKIGESGTIKNITYKGTEYISNVDSDGDIAIGGKKQTLLNGLTLENNIFIVNFDNSSGGGGADAGTGGDAPNLTESDSGYFSFSASTKTITKFHPFGIGKDLPELRTPVIPAKINGIDVQKIGANAFTYYTSASNGHKTYTGLDLTSVSIPSGVTEIGNSAFRGNKLTNLILPDTIKIIEAYSFQDNLIKDMNAPDSITAIGSSAFQGNKLTNVIIPKNINIVGQNVYAFNEIQEVQIHDNVTRFEPYAFYHNKIQNLHLPESVRVIGASAFSINEIASVNLPFALNTIGALAFEDNKLTSIKIPGNVKILNQGAFYYNYLTRVELFSFTPGGGAFSKNGPLQNSEGIKNDVSGTYILNGTVWELETP